ncbi:MAG: VOC family protein [Alphaproteobacteria bacterium]
MLQTPPENTQRVIPYLTYKDAPAAIDFVCKAFGFTEDMRMPGPDGDIMHANLKYDGNAVMLASEMDGSSYKAPGNVSAPTSFVFMYVDDVDAHHAQATKSGAKIIVDLEDQFWGERTYTCEDPEGGRWMFSTVVAEFDPSQMPG